jgi:Protein of unknown function (DUF3592)
LQPQLIAPGVGVLIAGIVLTAQQGIPVYRAIRSRHWPHVTGEILSARLDDRLIGGYRGMMARVLVPNVRYQYAVENKQFIGTDVAYGAGYREVEVAVLVRTLKQGDKVDVYYDPKSPRRAVLKPGARGDPVMYAVIGAVIMVVGVVMLGRAAT